MDIFSIGIIVLFIMSIIFYVVSFSFIYYWHLVKISCVVVPALWTFEFFVMGVFAVSLTAIILNYLPALIKLLSAS